MRSILVIRLQSFFFLVIYLHLFLSPVPADIIIPIDKESKQMVLRLSLQGEGIALTAHIPSRLNNSETASQMMERTIQELIREHQSAQQNGTIDEEKSNEIWDRVFPPEGRLVRYRSKDQFRKKLASIIDGYLVQNAAAIQRLKKGSDESQAVLNSNKSNDDMTVEILGRINGLRNSLDGSYYTIPIGELKGMGYEVHQTNLYLTNFPTSILDSNQAIVDRLQELHTIAAKFYQASETYQMSSTVGSTQPHTDLKNVLKAYDKFLKNYEVRIRGESDYGVSSFLLAERAAALENAKKVVELGLLKLKLHEVRQQANQKFRDAIHITFTRFFAKLISNAYMAAFLKLQVWAEVDQAVQSRQLFLPQQIDSRIAASFAGHTLTTANGGECKLLSMKDLTGVLALELAKEVAK